MRSLSEVGRQDDEANYWQGKMGHGVSSLTSRTIKFLMQRKGVI